MRSEILKQLVTGVAFCGLVTGCSDGKAPKTAHVAVPESAPTSADPTAATKQAILPGYSGMWSDYEKDSLTANWEHPTVVNHATSKALLWPDQNQSRPPLRMDRQGACSLTPSRSFHDTRDQSDIRKCA